MPKADKINLEMFNTDSMQKGYLAFIDVLGFREGVMGPESLEYVNQYLNIINNLLNKRQHSSVENIQALVVSDSIIITAPESIDPLLFIKFCSELLFDLILKMVPVRGAISFGKYLREVVGPAGGNIFIAGPALVEAYEVEKTQEWVGIVLCPSIQNSLYKDLANWSWLPPRYEIYNYLYRFEKVPFKSDESSIEEIESLVIYPRFSRGTVLLRKQFIKNLTRMLVSTFDKKNRQKYLHTISFYKLVYSRFEGDYHGPINMESFQAIKNKLLEKPNIQIPIKDRSKWYKLVIGQNEASVKVIAEIEKYFNRAVANNLLEE